MKFRYLSFHKSYPLLKCLASRLENEGEAERRRRTKEKNKEEGGIRREKKREGEE